VMKAVAKSGNPAPAGTPKGGSGVQATSRAT
jgi:hypothetical protein